jgi:hypothetical protein
MRGGSDWRVLLLTLGCALAVASPAAAATKRPDLVVSAVSVAPGSVLAGGQLTIKDKVRNTGTSPAKASLAGYYLSADAVKGKGDLRLGRRTVPKLQRRKSSSKTVALTLPPLVTGTFRLIECADDARKVKESNERNNCRTAAASLTINTAPPLGGQPQPTTTPATTTAPATTSSDTTGTGTGDGGSGGSTGSGGGGGGGGPQPTTEVCNGADDDLDGQVDEDVCVVTVSMNGTSGPTVTSAPAGISCPTTCAARFTPFASAITLTASLPANVGIVGWGGACSGRAPTCDLTAGDKTASITFGPDGDGDGLADSVDCAPSVANPSWAAPGTCYADASIYDVRKGLVDTSAGNGAYVTRALVTAVAPGGNRAWIAVLPADITPADGAQFSAIEIDVSAMSPKPAVNVGDQVKVGGMTTTTLLTAAHYEVLSTGNPITAFGVDPATVNGSCRAA